MKTAEAAAILAALGLPSKQCNERSALTLLALANIRKTSKWSGASSPLLRIWDIMAFMREHYGKDYAANSRETIRRQTIHQFEQARLVNKNPDDPKRPTNSGNTKYQLTPEVLDVLKSHGTQDFDDTVSAFKANNGSLSFRYRKAKDDNSVKIDVKDVGHSGTIKLTPGAHNELQAQIVSKLAPRFFPNATLLYLGDTANKHVVFENDQLASLGIPVTQHDKLPDVVFYVSLKDWIVLVEAVTSHGPVSPKRLIELQAMLSASSKKAVFISAFPDQSTFRKYAADIAWETEVWIASEPDHMIHFNGDKFLR